MKRTTYILIGVLVSVLMALIAGVVYISFQNFDLDNVNSWGVHECAIDAEYLTGSDKHRNNLQKGECRQVFWTPKQEGAELSVTFAEKGHLTLRPE